MMFSSKGKKQAYCNSRDAGCARERNGNTAYENALTVLFEVRRLVFKRVGQRDDSSGQA